MLPGGFSMRNLFLSIIFLFFISLSSIISASDRNDSNISKEDFTYQLESLKSKVRSSENNDNRHKELLKANIKYLEKSVIRKKEKMIKRLEANQQRLESSENGQEVQQWLKKVKSMEKKIQDIDEILFGIELLKTKCELW